LQIGVVFFRTEGGNEPVLDWLRDLGPVDRKTIGEDLRTVQLGWPIGMPVCRPLGDGLYEVRSNITDKRIARLLFFQHGQSLVVVEGFIKKTQATPKEVLDSARRRKSEYERNAKVPTAQAKRPKTK
jgi:phage-related protein